MKNGKAPSRVAIVGLGPTSGAYIQDVDKAGDRYKLFDETWTFNSYCNVIESDRLFHMDDVLVQEIRAKADGPYSSRIAGMLEAMKRYKGPIYTSFADERFPTMVNYPLKDVIQRFGSMYFTTTPPYAVAYAAMIGVEELTIYGCDYTWPGQADAEGGRSCMEYWIGRVQSLGLKVAVHRYSTLMDTNKSYKDDIKLYGYDRVRISMEDMGQGKVKLVLTEKDLPTAQEMEERYSHRKPGSGVSLDVVN